MKTSLEQLLKNANRLYSNMERLLIAFNNIDNGSAKNITVTLLDEDGNDIKYTLKNNVYIQNEVDRLKNNFDNLVNANPSYLLNGDGSLSKFFKTDFTNTGKINNLQNTVNCVISYDSIIDNLTFPNVKLPIKIDNDLVENNIQATIFTVESGFDKIKDKITLQELKYLIDTKSVYADFKTINLQTHKQQIDSYGIFSILNVEETSDENIFICKVDTINYEKLNINSELFKDDILVDEQTKYIIEDVDKINFVLKLRRIEGKDVPKVGIKNLIFNSVVNTDDKYVNVPVLPNKNIVVFLSSTNELSISYPSLGLKIDTTNLTVTTKSDGTITIRDYYQKYVTNITEYFESLVNDSSIPLSLGIKPETIKLDSRNFNVIQINKHLTNKLTRDQLEKLNTEKTDIKNDITFANEKITQFEKELSTKTLKTKEEVDYRNKAIIDLRNKIQILEVNLLAVTTKIDNNAVKFGLKHTKPKYKIVGFCKEIGKILSTKTRPQQIIKYEFQYRYLSKNNEEINSTSLKLYDEEDVRNITISPWNTAKTKTLTKVLNENTNKYDWKESRLDSSEDININQCMISINEGESVEIRVRAISEAGYPISTLSGDWSNILKVDFPLDLTENSVNLLVNKNIDDLKIAEFRAIIRDTGLYNHLNDTVTDGKNKFHHTTLNIASGFYTEDERKIIPLFDWMNEIQQRVKNVESRKLTENIQIQFVDYNNDLFNVEDGTVLEIDGGAYSDRVNLLDEEKYGTIVKLQNFIKIVNSNNTPVEIKSLAPNLGELTQIENPEYFNVPVYTPNGYKQNKKQIIYFRNVDITKQKSNDFTLYVDNDGQTTSIIPPALIDLNANDSDKKVIYLDNSNNIKKVKLKRNENLDFVAYSTEHPLFDETKPSKIAQLKDDMDRLKLLNPNIKLKNKQEKFNSNLFLGFKENDKYAIGNNTTGAFLYPLFNNIKKLEVVGNNTTSSVIIQKNSEILIPVIFEYRFMDRKGIINGDTNLSVTDNIKYAKKLGIDLLINNELVSFDLEFKAQFKAPIPAIDTLNIPGITSNTKNP